MEETAPRQLEVDGLVGYAPEIGCRLWMLEEGRRRTQERLAGLTDGDLGWAPAASENSIGALLYHIAAIEADWLYAEVLQRPFPPEIAALFPDDVRDGQGQLATDRGEPLETHVQRLATVRAAVLAAFLGMSLAEFRRPRLLPDYAVTPEWVLHHLTQHEAEHRGEIGMLRQLRALQPGSERPGPSAAGTESAFLLAGHRRGTRQRGRPRHRKLKEERHDRDRLHAIQRGTPSQ